MNVFSFSQLRSKLVYRAFMILELRDRRKLLLFIGIHFTLSFLDLIGIGLIGILISLVTSGEPVKDDGIFTSHVLSTLGIANSPLNEQIVFLGISASVILIVKMFAILALLRRLNKFMSRRSAGVSGSLVLRLLSTSLLRLQSRTIQESLWLVTHGVTTLFIEVIVVTVVMIGDLLLITLMLLLLYFVNPFIALSAIIVFGFIGVVLFLVLKRRALLNGKILAEQQVKSNQEIYEVLESYRETYVKNRRYFYAIQIKKTRYDLANSLALKSYLPNVSKYAFETVVTLGVLLFAAIQFSIADNQTAITAIGLFLGASSRIAPSVMRLQQNALTLKSASGTAAPALSLFDELNSVCPLSQVDDLIDTDYKGFEAEIVLRDVSFTYPGKDIPVLDRISLTLHPGKIYAVVGPSGAGKTTLIDLILGILSPDSGVVEISGVAPSLAIQTWPGAIAYLPQNVSIVNGSISDNISLGYPKELRNPELRDSAIKISQLDDFVANLPLGVETYVGDRGTKLSGGQRQRLGIARALYTKPKLLFLDEATSALDGQTEEQVSNAILEMEGLTVLTIAHRLSTIRKANSVIYINDGKVEAIGTFEEVRKMSPEFNNQINQMSL